MSRRSNCLAFATQISHILAVKKFAKLGAVNLTGLSNNKKGVNYRDIKPTYYSLDEIPELTLVAGAKCKDGVVIVGDRQYSDIFGNDLGHNTKLFADLFTVVIGFTGVSDIFQIFRKYLVGDVMISRDAGDKYTDDNLIPKLSTLVKKFNDLECGANSHFEILVARQCPKRELQYINSEGEAREVQYWAIGTGKGAADMFCADLEYEKITMLDFVKQAYLAIRYAEIVGMMPSVGVCDNHPDVHLFYDNTKQDVPVPPDTFVEYRRVIDAAVEEMKKEHKEVLKRLKLI